MPLIPLISDYLYIPVLLALVGAGISVYTDIRWGKIKNFITFPLILTGWTWSLVFGGINFFVFNLVISIAVGFVARFAGQLGAGDIKLLIGIAACLQPMLNVLFLALYFIVLLVSALWVRIKINNFNLKNSFQAIKTEIMLELGGLKQAGMTVHGEKVKHLGGPVIFLALILTLLKWRLGG